ncbi:histidine phosphatase family protein [Nocardiopsis sp. RSe5-2]|uniref:Histidine phosphatase family protein n=1 Tax=Nocardiopsis endophytica TaxID=3018445 RepID=A0ABT4U323_9ACTN|nr:histidine phosphatase family protein [Nocardiopsis endophytica]MDA2811352.1 histidine phosphatase family protein [Nocardiopsis endophytica]
MAVRHLYVARHGAADAFGEVTDAGLRQMGLLAERLAALPVDAVWHSPLPRAVRSAKVVGECLPGVPVREAEELIDHVPHVPDDPPPGWAGFFDGFDPAEAAEGARLAGALLDRFARPAETETHEVLITHGYQVAWLVRHAMGAPPDRWLGLSCGNASLTAIGHYGAGPPSLVLYNDMGHLPPDLRWTGFGPGTRP